MYLMRAWPNQFPERLANGSYFGGGRTEVAWAKAFYTKYFLPLLKPHQSIWLVPGEQLTNYDACGINRPFQSMHD